MKSDNYDILIKRLDEFIRKFYKNQLIKGAIYFSALVLLLFLLVITLEYFGHYNSYVRAILFYIFIGLSVYFLVQFVLIPVVKLLKIGKTISYSDASEIIGQHFPSVKDKLLNTLQLKREADTQQDITLIEAAISQKIEQLRPVPFVAAIDLRKNIRYARYVLFPVVLYAIIYIVSPGMITDGSKRVLQYNQTFKPQAPFQFIIENPVLEAEQFADFKLEIALTGAELPNEVYVVKDGNNFKMQKVDNTHFSYTFSSLKEETPFNLEADNFLSDDYRIEVLAKPQLINYQVHAHYPAYLKQQDETFNSPGDLTIPAGTVLSWKFVTKQTDEVLLGFNGSELKAEQKEKDVFTYTKKLFIPTDYFIKTRNGKAKSDSMQYAINVVADAYPAITVEENADSLTGKQRYFIGDASDDHGLTKLTFNYRFIKSEDAGKQKQGLQTKAIPMSRNELSQRFYYQFMLDEIGVEPSDEVEYYFEVWDNDGVHAPKSAKSKVMLFKAPSVKELEQKSEAGNSALKSEMEEAIKEAKSMQKELKSLEQKMQEKRELTWEEKKKLDNLLERQRKLNEQIEQIKNEQKKLNEQEAEFKKQSEEMLQKQEQLEKLFNEVMNDEMKKMIQQLEQLMQQQNKDKIKQEMEKMQLNNKDVEKELDRMLEQFKQLELEKKMEDAVDKLDKLEEKQRDLSKKSDELANDKKLNKEEKKQQAEELKKEQEKANEEFKDLQQELKDIEQKNKELEQPKDLENTEKEQQEIEQNMQESEEMLEKNEPSKSSSKQKQASEKMQDMSAKMKKNMQSEKEKEAEINAEALREILENTIQLSKDQEKLMEDFKQINGYNPQYVDIAKEQKKIKDNAKIIEDSLLALSKKAPEISSFVNREVSKLNDNLDKSIEGFSTRNFGQIRTQQQSAMMHANNLGVMLSEVLKQMQQEMSGKSSESGNKPKNSKGQGQGKGKKQGQNMGSMKKMQEELNKQLREGMNKSGEGKPGMSSEEYARMAAQQMAIRQQMQKMLQQMGAQEKEQLGGNGKLQEMQKMMEQTEKELFNKKLSSEMLQRQEDILTRLLESEKAERKQEQDKKREAEQAKEKPRATPPNFEPYIKQKQKEQELLETIPAEMQPYYKEKAKEYFNKVGD